MARHGVKKKAGEYDFAELSEDALKAQWDAEDVKQSDEFLLAQPKEKRAELKAQMDKARERRWWSGSDWPRPNPTDVPRKVAIVGFGTTGILAPFGEEGWELWSLNDPQVRTGVPPREAFTRWFQLHPPRYLKKHYKRGMEDLFYHWGEKTGIRLYMDRHYDEYPDSEPYPKEQIDRMVPHGWFHASSFDWMLALAIHEGFEEIALYGCNFYLFPIMNREPMSGLPCLSYWCGVAEGRGIKVTVHDGGHLFKILHFAAYESGLQYGWDHEPALDLGTDTDRKWRDVR